MGHKQPPTPIQTDNLTAFGIVNSSIRQRKSKAMDMLFYCMQDKYNSGQFVVYWKPGHNNLGDYFTKHHSTPHHKEMRQIYLHTGASANSGISSTGLSLHSDWQGCVDPYFLPQPNRGKERELPTPMGIRRATAHMNPASHNNRYKASLQHSTLDT